MAVRATRWEPERRASSIVRKRTTSQSGIPDCGRANSTAWRCQGVSQASGTCATVRERTTSRPEVRNSGLRHEQFCASEWEDCATGSRCGSAGSRRLEPVLLRGKILCSEGECRTESLSAQAARWAENGSHGGEPLAAARASRGRAQLGPRRRGVGYRRATSVRPPCRSWDVQRTSRALLTRWTEEEGSSQLSPTSTTAASKRALVRTRGA
jgi:hypothetical protein